MSIIEQAAKRLELLRRAGVAVTGNAKPGTFGGANSLANEVVARVDDPDAETRDAREVELDFEMIKAAGFITPDSSRSQLADEYRIVKRPLIDNVRGKSAAPIVRANCIMITSSMPAEGKTFTSINLALSIVQELDTRVLLIDADVVRPAVLNRLGLPVARGLMDLLIEHETSYADVILKTNVPGLSLLPAGTPHERATELLASADMTRVVNDLAGRYADRILIFDAPPLLVSTESQVLAAQLGQIIVVVEAGRTTRAQLDEALGRIDNCPVVSLLLNKNRASGVAAVGSYYGY